MRMNRTPPIQTGALLAIVMAVVSGVLSTEVGANGDDKTAGMSSFSDIQALEARRPSLERAYGPDPLQTTLLFEAVGSLKRQVALIHGGCWSNQYARAHIAPLASALAGAGFNVWVPEYRRVGDTGGGWPGT